MEATAALPAVPDARCSTLTPASVRVLQAAGAWHTVLESGRAAEFDTMQVWDGAGGGCVRYSAAEAGLPLLGHVVENRLLAGSLAAQLRRNAAVGEGLELLVDDELCELHLPGAAGADLPADTVGDITFGPDWTAARLLRGGWLRARLVVAADGKSSRCRGLAGVRSVGWRYGQQAVVGTVACEPHRTAWQRFTAEGCLALLPLAGSYSSVVWSTGEAHAARLVAASPAAFAEEVDAALQGGELGAGCGASILRSLTSRPVPPAWTRPPRISSPSGASPRGCIPLALSHAGVYSAHRLALVGDAAHSVHPLAGQGLNLGISDAALLADAIASGVRDGRDCGEAALLAQYGRSAAAANLPFLAGLEALQRLFASQQPGVVAVRSFGLELVQSLPAVRRAIVAYATGAEVTTLRAEGHPTTAV